MKIKLVICSIIFTIVFGICNNIYAREYINNTNLEMETTISSHAGNVEELTNEFGIYYTVTFIDEVRNTRVVKRVKEGDVVKPELVSDEYIYINEETFQFFENWTIHRGGKT